MCILQWGLCNLKLYEIIILALNDGKYSWAERCALPLPPGAERASGCSLYWCFICRSFSQTRSKSMCSSCYFAVWDLSHMVSVTARARVPFRSDVWRRLMNFCSQSNTDCKPGTCRGGGGGCLSTCPFSPWCPKCPFLSRQLFFFVFVFFCN